MNADLLDTLRRAEEALREGGLHSFANEMRECLDEAEAECRPALAGSTAPLTREERVWVMKRFLADVGPDKAAEFVVNLQDSADGLGKNQREYEAHFARMYKAR